MIRINYMTGKPVLSVIEERGREGREVMFKADAIRPDRSISRMSVVLQ
jgi:hypothetical protein